LESERQVLLPVAEARSNAGTLADAGARLCDGEEYLALRLEGALRTAAPELIGVEETQRLLDALARKAPTLVREVVPQRIDLGGLAEILRRLVAEGLPVGD